MAPNSCKISLLTLKILSKSRFLPNDPLTLIYIPILIQIFSPSMSLAFVQLTFINLAICIKELADTIMIALPFAFYFLSKCKKVCPETFSFVFLVISNKIVAAFIEKAAASMSLIIVPLTFENVPIVKNHNTISFFESIFPDALK